MLELFAVSPPGLEPMLAEELRDLGVQTGTVIEGGVSFQGGLDELYRTNLRLRIASRILVRVARFHASAFHELERQLLRVGWGDFVTPASNASIRVTCRKSKLYHSDAVAERVARVLHDVTGATVVRASDPVDPATAPSDQVADPGRPAESQLLVVRLYRDTCTISADSSGEHLHVRGYREASAKAPLRENLAAALVRASRWKGEAPLWDPMCGAGTIAIEAALIARSIAPALARSGRSSRRFAFERWLNHDPGRWESAVALSRGEIRERAPVRILATDRDHGAIEAAVSNARRAGVEDDITIERRTLSELERIGEFGYVVTNPPYGKRVGDQRTLRNLFVSLGRTLRAELGGWKMTALSADPANERAMGIRCSVVGRTTNGGIPVRLIVARVPR